MTRRAPGLAVVALAVAIGVVIPASPAVANTPPIPFTPAGVSWVDVDPAERVYLESFDQDWDDYAIFSVPAGISCTSNSVSADGPFLTADDGLDETDCVDTDMNPIDPIDPDSRTGAVALGFAINFFGTMYTDVYPNTNGGISFDAPDGNYDQTLASLANDSQTSGMYPLGADLFYAPGASNFWTAQTTIDGNDAMVFAWEDFHNCCTDAPSDEQMSFQLVIIDLGGGDFDAWFNFDAVIDFTEGYDAPAALVNLSSGVTPGSNVFVARDVTNVPTDCTAMYGEIFGTATDADFADAAGDEDVTLYYRLVNAASRTISVWEDAACTTPIAPSMRQDEGSDLIAYVQFSGDSEFSSIGSGWSTYNPVTGEIDATELLFNIDSDDLVDSATNPLIERSLNTTVPGRFVIGQRDGGTVGDSAAPPAPPAPELAATGVNTTASVTLAALAALLFTAGVLAVVRRRRVA